MVVFLIIAAILLCIISALLLSVVSVDISFFGEFELTVKLAGITVYKPKEQPAEPKEEIKKEPKPDTEKSNFFQKIKEKRGFAGAVKELFYFADTCFKKIRKLLKHIKIKKLFLDIIVASSDAATTALEYGAVCSCVYPVLSFLTSAADVKLKQVNIKSDFNAFNPDLSFSLSARLRIVYLLIAAAGLLSEYNNFKARNDL